MTSEWKIKQEIYHRLNTEHTDDLNKVDIVITENVKEDALRHFVEYVYIYDNIEWPIPMTGMVPDIKEYYNVEIGSK